MKPSRQIVGTLGVIACGLGLVVGVPQVAKAQFPNIPGVQLPQPPHLAPPPANPFPPAPDVLPPPGPPLPAPQLPLPQLPAAPLPPPAPGMEWLPPELHGKGIEPGKIGGFDFTPPEPIPGMLTPTGNPFIIRADSTTLVGNVKLSYVQIDTLQGPRPAIRIDSDRVILDNLSVQFPSSNPAFPAMWQRTGKGVTTTLNGNFHIIVTKLTVTPQIAGIQLPIPITIDSTWAPEQIRAELTKVGSGLPDELSKLMVMKNGEMETYFVSADDLRAEEAMTISP